MHIIPLWADLALRIVPIILMVPGTIRNLRDLTPKQ